MFVRVFGATALILVGGAMPASLVARTNYDFHGLLLTCPNLPPITITGFGHAYAYAADLTEYVEGSAKLGNDSVTVSFPRRYPSFTITRKAGKFYVGKAACDVDDM